MNGTKGNKPVCERQIPYDLTYKWNLINKTNKQNITRDIEIKNKLAVTREGKDNGVKWRKGHQGTCIKDPWTKPKRGRIKGGRWGWLGSGRVGGGRNGDNCT